MSAALPASAPPTIAEMPNIDRRAKHQRTSSDSVARYLGELQAEVMQVFWERDSATVREVVDDLNKRRRRKLAYTTVLTLVSRLFARGLLDREPEGRGFRYRPARSRDELLAELSDELIDRLLDDFGELAIARFDARVGKLDGDRKAKLRAARKR